MSENDAAMASHDDSPELTDADFARAISFADVLAPHAERVRMVPGEKGRASIALDLDADLVRIIKAIGPDYESRIEAVLREAVADGKL